MRLVLLTAPLLLIGCDMLNNADSSVPPPDAEPGGAVIGEPAETAAAADNSTPDAARRTVASLGDPGRGGLWLETPLVKQETPGRVRVVASGASAAVTLIPAPGAATSGSRISLAAMQELGVSPGDLVELEVSTGG